MHAHSMPSVRRVGRTLLTCLFVALGCFAVSHANAADKREPQDDSNRIPDDYKKYTPDYSEKRFHRPFLTLDFGREVLKTPDGTAWFQRQPDGKGFTGFLEPTPAGGQSASSRQTLSPIT